MFSAARRARGLDTRFLPVFRKRFFPARPAESEITENTEAKREHRVAQKETLEPGPAEAEFNIRPELAKG